MTRWIAVPLLHGSFVKGVRVSCARAHTNDTMMANKLMLSSQWRTGLRFLATKASDYPGLHAFKSSSKEGPVALSYANNEKNAKGRRLNAV